MNFLRKNYKLIIYTLCGLGLIWIDLWRGIGNGAQWAFAVNCTGFCIFPMIALRLDWRILLPGHKSDSFDKRSDDAGNKSSVIFYAWILLSCILAYPAFRHFAPGTDYDAQVITAIINVILYGAVAIRVFWNLFFERKDAGKKRNITKLFWLWFWFMALAVASVNRSLWPLWFLVMFGSFYLAPLSRKDASEIIEGIVNGLILGFFLIQGRAFLYRPYDLDVRYRGHYTNVNVNAMFYLYVYIAWLVKLTVFRIRKLRIPYVITFVFASAMWCFVFFTGSRSAWLAFAGVTVCYWLADLKERGVKKLLSFICRGALVGVTAAVMFFPVFACMRYIPALRHHPIWYQDEYHGEESNVMSWDPIDSPKYSELDEIIPELLGRLSRVFGAFGGEDNNSVSDCCIDNEWKYDGTVAEAEKCNDISALEMYILGIQGPFLQVADASVECDAVCSVTLVSDLGRGPQYSPDGERAYYYADGVEPGTDEEHPIFIRPQYESSFLRRLLQLRYYIYKYDISRLHFLGNESSEMAVWVCPDFFQLHAHNSVLQIMYWFGPLCGLFFLAGMIAVSICAALKCRECRNARNTDAEHVKCGNAETFLPCYIFSLIAMTGYFLMGLTECTVFPGELGLVLYFLAFLPFMVPDTIKNS